MDTFDFESFAREESHQAQFNDFMQAIQENGNPELANRFADLRRRHRIENEEDPQPNFHFDTANLTYEEVARHCAANGINLRRVVFVQGDRFYVSRNYVIGENQVWDEIASPSSVDIQQESAQLAFLDTKKTIVDWPLTLENLNNMIRQKPYSQAMLRNCLLRFVNHYESAQTEYLRDKTCDQIANFLLSLNTRIDRRAYHKSKLLSAVRRPDETLSAAVHKVRNIAENIYANVPGPAPGAAQPAAGGPQAAAGGDPAVPAVPGAAQPAAGAAAELNPIINRILINAIISFCRDDLAIPLNKKVLSDSHLSRLKDYNYYLRIAMAAEQRQNAFPTVPLRYSRKLPNSPDSLAALNSITVPDIHPCLHISPRKNASAGLVEHYFPFHTPDQNEDANQFFNANAGLPLLGPHLPLGNDAEDRQARAYVPLPMVIPPAVPAQHYPPVQAHPMAPVHPAHPPVPPVLARPAVPAVPAVPAQLINAPVFPAIPVLQPRPIVNDPNYHVEGPNVVPQLPPLGAQALPVQPPVMKTILWTDLPAGIKINTQKEGQYVLLGGEKYLIEYNNPPINYMETNPQPVTVDTRVVGTRSKTRNRPRSIQDRPLPEPRDRSEEHGDTEKANIYAEVLSMMMQNLARPSGIPDRGRSRDRQNPPRSRDNSRDRGRNLSGDRQGRQPRRDGSWNRPGYNAANGPRDRLRVYGDRTPSRDRNGYRPSARPDQRQPNNYSQRDTYKKPNYSGSTRDSSKDDSQRRRDGSAEAKRLAREGARKTSDRPLSNDRNRSRDRTPDRRDISRDRSYEGKRMLFQEDAMSKAYPEMKRGFNCSANYNPAVKKTCTKCPLSSAHHEFACRKYARYNYNLCSLCDKYHHYPSECKEVPKYPPKQADTNHVYCTEEDDPN